ncbi:TPA: hypothetical protein ACOJ06_004080, partial [Enterobacter cloacae]
PGLIGYEPGFPKHPFCPKRVNEPLIQFYFSSTIIAHEVIVCKIVTSLISIKNRGIYGNGFLPSGG